MRKRLIIIAIISLIAVTFSSCGNTKSVDETSISTQDAQEETVTSVSESVLEVSIEPEEVAEPEPVIEEEEPMGAAKLLYQGHASIRIVTAEGKVIYVDPFIGDGYDLPADLILLTHGHYDHTQTDMIKTKNADCETISWKEAIKDGEHRTFEYDFVKVEAVEAGYNKNHSVNDCVGYILTFSNGVTLYLSGDTSTTKDMESMAERNLDYAFFCCDGIYNMDMAEAIECAKLVGAKHNIPYHMIPANSGNGFDQAVAETFEVPGKMIVAQGEEIELN